MQSAFDEFVLVKVGLAIQGATQIDPAQISPTTRLVDDLGLRRFGRLRLAICLEEAFDDELSDDALERFVTVGDIIRYFSRRIFRDHVSRLPAALAA